MFLRPFPLLLCLACALRHKQQRVLISNGQGFDEESAPQTPPPPHTHTLRIWFCKFSYKEVNNVTRGLESFKRKLKLQINYYGTNSLRKLLTIYLTGKSLITDLILQYLLRHSFIASFAA